MPLPKLSPLQSRLAASLVASVMLLMLYFAISFPHFAYAAEIDSIRQEDHNHERLPGPILEVDLEQLELREVRQYEGHFVGYDGAVIGRAPQAATATTPTALENNIPITTNVEQGQTVPFSFLKASVYGDLSPATSGLPSAIRRSITDAQQDGEVTESLEQREEDIPEPEIKARQSTDPRTVYISVNVCLQPSPLQNTTVEPPPQLQLYVSQSASNTNPGPGQDPATQTMTLLVGGATMYSLNATGDIFIGLYGETTTAYKDVWSAQIAASIDGFFHTYNNGSDPNLYLVDGDNVSGFLRTRNLTNAVKNSTTYEAWMNHAPPFVIFANPKDDTSINGIQNSYCGMLRSSIGPTVNGTSSNKVQTSITNIGNGQPRQQFYISDLSADTTYNIALGMYGNSTLAGNGVVGGGGQVWPLTSFSTNSDGNCAMIFGLSFCDQTAYAVPSNPKTFPNLTSLASFYDNNTQLQYANFQKAIQQIPCETTSSAQFSLVRTCDDCAVAYKEWLCSVTIPRCTDFSSPDSMWWLQKRNMIQPFPNGTSLPQAEIDFANTTAYLSTSRNPNIDTVVQPGPYKEILPCEDSCYNLVQSCPSAFGFGCPRPGDTTFNFSYGILPNPQKFPEQLHQVTCNYPGASTDVVVSKGSRMDRSGMVALVALVATGLMFL